MSSRRARRPATRFIAGALCLDFANTNDWHASAHPVERLTRYDDLVAWGRQAGLLGRARAAEILTEAGRHRAAAVRSLKRARALREVLYRLAVALVKQEPPAAADLALFNREIQSAARRLRIAPGRDGLAWSWDGGQSVLDWFCGPILHSAVDLFTSEMQGRVGQCADDRGCGWLFLDSTKNHSRRWCDMDDCGNRAKARRHHRRVRGRAVKGNGPRELKRTGRTRPAGQKRGAQTTRRLPERFKEVSR